MNIWYKKTLKKSSMDKVSDLELEYLLKRFNKHNPMINFNELRYCIRKNTSFDYGSKFEIDFSSLDGDTLKVNCIGKCGGKKYNLNCSLFEFDWIDMNNNIINSNIPYSPHLEVIEHGVVIDNFFNEKYNYYLNCKL